MRLNADTLLTQVTAYFHDHAAALRLDQQSLTVEYVLNWGGFENYSYRISDARRAYHLKLSASPEDREALRRWWSLAPQLTVFRAPPVLDWIDVGAASGLLFQFIPGNAPDLSGEVVGELFPVLARLNADSALAESLQPARTLTACDAYRNSFHDRFTEDLRGIRETPPPFIHEGLLHWMEDEARALSERVAAAPAFSEPLTTPVHGDLWLNNILWQDRRDWYLLDWDDLRIGDPAADFATLLGPNARDLTPLKLMQHVNGHLSRTQRERLQLLGRATLLDWVIDPVADWLEASALGAASDERYVRVEKERIHGAALALYRQVYA